MTSETPAPAAGHSALADKVVKASLSVAAAHLLFRLSGFILSLTVTACFDKIQYEAVMTIAFGFVWYLFLTGEELIGPAFLPVFMKAKDEDGERAAWDFTNALLTLQSLILLAVILAIICFPDFFIQSLVDDKQWGLIKDYYEQKKHLAGPELQAAMEAHSRLLRHSLQVMTPALFFFSLGSTTYMLLNGYKKFFLAALGDAAWKFTAIGAALLGSTLFGGGIMALCFGILAGSSVKIVTHLAGLRGRLSWFRPNFRWNNPHLKAFLVLIAPLIVGILFAKFRDGYNNIHLPSALEPGMMQAQDLSKKLGSTLAMIVPFALQIALFPFLCELVDRDDKKALGNVLTHSSRMLLSVFMPLAVALAAAAAPLAFLIFYRGEMDFEVACWVGIGMSVYMFVLPAMALENILMQGCFANRKMVAMTVLGIVCSVLSMLGGWLFVERLGWTGVRALVVIIGSFVFSRWVKSLLLVLVMKRNLPIFAWRETLSFAFRLGAVSALLWLAVHYADVGVVKLMGDNLAAAAGKYGPGTLHPAVSKLAIFCRVAACATTAALAGAALLWLFRVREPFEMALWAWRKAAVKARIRQV